MPKTKWRQNADLLDYLRHSMLRTIRFEENTGMNDSEDITLIIYFNGVRRYLRSNDPPGAALPLIRFLRDIEMHAKLQDAEPRKLEK